MAFEEFEKVVLSKIDIDVTLTLDYLKENMKIKVINKATKIFSDCKSKNAEKLLNEMKKDIEKKVLKKLKSKKIKQEGGDWTEQYVNELLK